jgi:UDP-N-acetyl-D-glucosamine dehydrogenase
MKNNTKKELRDKIEQRTAQIAVIGLGYVGLPMCIEFARAGFSVVGIDNNQDRVTQLKSGKSYILDVTDQDLQAILERFSPTTNFRVLAETDAVVICVPTPLRKTKDPDLSYIVSVTSEIVKFLHRKQLVILESTTYPGTTDEIILPELEGTGLKIGEDFFLAFSPERIDPGNAKYNIRNTPKIVGGITPECGELAELLYQAITERVVRVSSTKSAEMVKLLENTFRAINIGMVNEVAIMCDKLGVDTWEVIDAAATKPFGFMPFYPGPGLGGHCIPIDPHYLSWKLKTLNYSAKFIELAGEINANMPHYVVNKIVDALNDDRKSVKGSKIVLMGLAYKKDSNDVRESPGLDILKLLKEKEADVVFHDPHVTKIHMDSEVINSEKLEPSLLKNADCVVIITDHSSYDWQFVVDHSKLIVDTRNAARKAERNNSCRVVKL